ncbi:hypothetical protein OHA72_35335 [Dactylosporangium sp. NBC_01737]|uniref:hypothetical protein n=1 Tax=Dactylosporangium sp. NBC_01737 TaxID=2975959 RepID=UPI002E0D4642|nr:hypothetical protein OHA72_35335 [Dactylosporangium sp. NBC_01737]
MVLVLAGGAAVFATSRPASHSAAAPEASATAGPDRPVTGDCPSAPPLFEGGNWALPSTAPGDVAPPGAVRAVLCRYNPVPELNTVRPGPPRRLVLTRDVAGLITVLNDLPTSDIDPCFSAGDGGGYLTLEYGDRTRATVELSNGCGFVRRGAVTRYQGGTAVEAFDVRYTAQELAVARPADVPPAGCVQRLTIGPAKARYDPQPVFDVWVGTHGFLPAPPAVVTACRFVRGSDGTWDRIREVTDRAVTGDAAAAVEAASKQALGEVPYLQCSADPKTIDVLLLRDALGETREVRATRDTCPVVTFDFDGAPPSTALDAVLDHLLGRPA